MSKGEKSERRWTNEDLDLLGAAKQIGVIGLAKRRKSGAATTEERSHSAAPNIVGRTTIPAHMLRRAEHQICVLAYTAKGTIVDNADTICERLQTGVRLICIILSRELAKVPPKPLKLPSNVLEELDDVHDGLKRIATAFPGQVELRRLYEYPTFTATAIDAGIDSSEQSRGSMLGVQPRVDGESVHSGLIIEIEHSRDGIWGVFQHGILYYHGQAKPELLCSCKQRFCTHYPDLVGP